MYEIMFFDNEGKKCTLAGLQYEDALYWGKRIRKLYNDACALRFEGQHICMITLD